MLPMKKLDTGFYNRADVVKIAKELIGKILITQFGEGITSGRIVETEAYAGAIDRASHAFNNRRTNRTEVMYKSGGVAYVYLIYGIHQLFNVVIHGAEECTSQAMDEKRGNRRNLTGCSSVAPKLSSCATIFHLS